MAVYILRIDDWLPTRLNAITRGKRRKGIRLSKKDRELVETYWKLAGHPPAQCKRRVSAAFFYTDWLNASDVDSHDKVLL